ncbi:MULTISPECIES: hypothetical protein [Miniimonas]|uniref:hypothetical protein n=1 Tax=Miniimonas TaxID=947525 RepID=UPI000D5293EC|nr:MULTISPECIES: hypothetical protein [Miniimonas]
MTTIPTFRPIDRTGMTDEATAVLAVTETVRSLLAGELAGETTLTASRPVPIAFLDDGRRVFLVVDDGPGRPADQPRSWGVEVHTDGDLVGDAPGAQTAVRTTRRLTPQAAADAARYVLAATAA